MHEQNTFCQQHKARLLYAHNVNPSGSGGANLIANYKDSSLFNDQETTIAAVQTITNTAKQSDRAFESTMTDMIASPNRI